METQAELITPDETILHKIHYIRGHKVMIDRDLAELYGVETKRLKEQVNRNRDRFPAPYMFELTPKEHASLSLRSQNATLKKGAHSKYLPYAFTEHGILMLSNVLKSKPAIQMSIRIIDVFIKLREMLFTQKDMLLKLEKLEKDVSAHNKEIRYIFDVLKKLVEQPKVPRKRIGFKKDDM